MKPGYRPLYVSVMVALLLCALCWAPARADGGAAASPLMFIENVGQFDPDVQYLVRGTGASAILTQEGLLFSVYQAAEGRPVPGKARSAGRVSTFRLSFVGANPAPRLEAFDRLSTTVSYFMGNDPDQWRVGVPVWRGVRYVDLYPGVDLEILGANGRWSWRLLPRAEAASTAGKQASLLADVRVQVDGAEVSIQDGQFRLSTSAGDLALPLLQVNSDGARLEPSLSPDNVVANPFVPVAEISNGTELSGAGDLVYSTYLGAGDTDEAFSVAVDNSGNVYVAGYTASASFPTSPLPYDGTLNGIYDVFVTKLAPNGSDPIYSTFMGGSDDEYSLALDLDNSGNAYFTGATWSTNYPTTIGAYDTALAGSGANSDVFVTKLNTTGTALTFSTYLGGDGSDKGRGIVVGGSGYTYVTGETGVASSTSFPTTSGAYDRTHNGSADVFVTKFKFNGSGLLYSTLLGGSSSDVGYAIAVDGAGNAYVAGDTFWDSPQASNFPVTSGAFDEEHNGSSDAFAAKLNTTGTGLVYSTFLGGSEADWAQALALDNAGCVYLAGPTYWTDQPHPSDFPTTFGAFDTSHNGGALGIDLFVAKLYADGSDLHYSTFLGGSENEGDDSVGIAVNTGGYAYVTGYTYWRSPSSPSDFPVTVSAYDLEHNGSQDAFLTQLSADGATLAYSTFVGGGDDDYADAVALGPDGGVHLAGGTASDDFPTLSPFQATLGGDYDAFIFKLYPSDTRSYYLTISTNYGTVTPTAGWHSEGVTLTISAEAPIAASGERYIWNGWSGSGAGSYTGSDNPASITMDGTIGEVASWAREYYLTVQTSPAGLATIGGEGWKTAGSMATTGTAPAAVLSGSDTLLFRGWLVDGESVAGNPVDVLMDGAHTAAARYSLLGSEPPETVGVSPAAGYSGPGTLQYFTTVYQDADGSDDIRYVEVLINSTVCLTKTVAARYDVQSNKLFIHDATRDFWRSSSITPGVPGTLSHNYMVLDGGESSVVRDTDTVTVTWAIRFTWRDSGKAYEIYLRAEDLQGHSDGWNDHGDWIVNRMPNYLIPPDTIDTSVSSGLKMTFNPRYRDLDLWPNLDTLYFAIANGLPAAVLIVEFARQLEDQGRGRWAAAAEAARLRLRPILMTSLAFIFGVVPLVWAIGAGAELRRALGTAVFSGMIGVTAFGLIFTPVFYVICRRLADLARSRSVRAPAVLSPGE